MLEIPKSVLSALEDYDTEPMRKLLDNYQRAHLFTFLTAEGEMITDENKSFKHNVNRVFQRFLSDAHKHLEKQISTGPFSQRRKARHTRVTIEKLASHLIPNYFDIHALVRLAKSLTLIVPDEIAFLTMHAVEGFNSDVTFENADYYFDDWTCDIYLSEFSSFEACYQPFTNYAPNYKNCFTAWVFRCFENNLLNWFVSEFNVLLNNFKHNFPNVYYAFCCSIQNGS